MENYCVYCHTLTDGRKYVGLTCYGDNPNRRWENGNGYIKDKNNVSYFGHAIQKYGWDNFKHEILENNLSKEEACEREKYYISLWKTNNKKYGFNLTSGGEGSSDVKWTADMRKAQSDRLKGKNTWSVNRKDSEDTKKKKSVAMKLKMQDKDYKDKILKALNKARDNVWNKGKKLSEVHKQKLKDSWDTERHQKQLKENHEKMCKPVLCVETGLKYKSSKDAEQKTGICYKTIRNCCLGKYKTAGGYHWQEID